MRGRSAILTPRPRGAADHRPRYPPKPEAPPRFPGQSRAPSLPPLGSIDQRIWTGAAKLLRADTGAAAGGRCVSRLVRPAHRRVASPRIGRVGGRRRCHRWHAGGHRRLICPLAGHVVRSRPPAARALHPTHRPGHLRLARRLHRPHRLGRGFAGQPSHDTGGRRHDSRRRRGGSRWRRLGGRRRLRHGYRGSARKLAVHRRRRGGGRRRRRLDGGGRGSGRLSWGRLSRRGSGELPRHGRGRRVGRRRRRGIWRRDRRFDNRRAGRAPRDLSRCRGDQRQCHRCRGDQNTLHHPTFFHKWAEYAEPSAGRFDA